MGGKREEGDICHLQRKGEKGEREEDSFFPRLAHTSSSLSPSFPICINGAKKRRGRGSFREAKGLSEKEGGV